MFAIPALTHVNLVDLHVELRARIRRTLLSPALSGKARASSGARTYAHQQRLYASYKAGRGNLAANPDYTWPNGRQGSAHMVQKARGYKRGNLSNAHSVAYAIDVGFYGSRLWSTLASTAAANGMILTVPGEPWHFECHPSSPLIALSGLNQGHPLRNAGIQTNLAKVGCFDGTVDGVYGPATMEGVLMFQSDTKTLKTGDWTVDDQSKLEEMLEEQGDTPSDPEVMKMILVRNNDKAHSHFGAVMYWPTGQPVGNPHFGNLVVRPDVHVMELDSGDTFMDMYTKARKAY